MNKDSQEGWVGITIDVKESEFYFCIKNKIPVLKEKECSDNNGLGIANTKKRLELLFPNCHSLEYTETKELFSVTLTITRSDNES